MITDRNKKHIAETIPSTTVVDSDTEQTDSDEEEQEERATKDKSPDNNDNRLHLVNTKMIDRMMDKFRLLRKR